MSQETAPPTREEISSAMNLAGGSFIRALAPSLLYADEVNYAKLEAAFPDEFRNYTAMALAFRDRLKETAPDLAPPAERYWLKAEHQAEYTEVTKAEYIRAEQTAGFHSKFGPDHPATSSFSGGSISGQTWEPTFRAAL